MINILHGVNRGRDVLYTHLQSAIQNQQAAIFQPAVGIDGTAGLDERMACVCAVASRESIYISVHIPSHYLHSMMRTPASQQLGGTSSVEGMIYELRGAKIILDEDLAAVYGVRTKVLNQAVKRNVSRFPADFIFRITPEEASMLDRLRSQIVTSSLRRTRGNTHVQVSGNSGEGKHGGRRYLPLAFTEHGAIMAATILNSPRAVAMSVFVVRAFVSMREFVGTHREIDARIRALEKKAADHDIHIASIINALRKLMAPPTPAKRRIGFQMDEAPQQERKPRSRRATRI
jgi:hypothetical protein